MRARLTVAILAAVLSGCGGCSKKGTGSDAGSTPTVDVPPASLGPNGIVVEQPHPGDTVSGAWVSVTGWIDRARWASVLVTGAAVRGFYAPMPGHLGVATVPVMVRADGRFVAPRVPLQDGAVQIQVIPLPPVATRAPPETVTLTVTATGTSSVPATLVATPPRGTAPLTVSLQAHSASGGTHRWEWDFEADAVQDAVAAEDTAVSHLYADAGVFGVTARTLAANGQWLYAVASVVPTSASQVLDQASAQSPRGLAVVTDFVGWQSGLTPDGVVGTGDDSALTQAVLMSDGDAVTVFDAHLHPRLSLTGLSRPTGVAGDVQGYFYVADTGNNRLVRFNADGSLDTTFGTQGAITTTADGTALRAPTALALGYWGDWDAPQPEVWLVDSGNDRLVLCSGTPLSCVAVTAVPTLHDDTSAPVAPKGLSALSATSDLTDILFAAPGGFFPGLFSDGTYLTSWSNVRGGSWFDVVATPGAPLLSLSSVPARGMVGMTRAGGADASGAFHEWLVGISHVAEGRREQLSYPVMALAYDSYASAFQWNAWRQAAGPISRIESGPVVAYLAGPGHVERRLLPSMEVLPW